MTQNFLEVIFLCASQSSCVYRGADSRVSISLPWLHRRAERQGGDMAELCACALCHPHCVVYPVRSGSPLAC